LASQTEGNEYFWDLADRSTRKEVKDILLSNLVSPNPLVMRAGANVIAQIAAIEIARNEWLEIVNALAENSMHEDLQIRRASITTLGFICEELKHTSNTVNSNTCEQILGSLLLGLSENSDLVEISLAALRESVPFLRRILENPYHCEKTFEYVLPLLSSPHTQRIY
jgi:importin subunit beta-1